MWLFETDQYVIMETKYDMQIKREKQKTRLILLCWLSFENLQQPTEKDVIKMSSQATDDGSDPVVSHILYQ